MHVSANIRNVKRRASACQDKGVWTGHETGSTFVSEVRTMHRFALSFAAAALVTSLAFADPGVRISYPQGATRVELEGNWSGCRYAVWRSEPATAMVPLF